MEDYIKAIYVLEEESGPPVATSAIAERVDKTAPTVTSMLDTLEDRGVVTREKYEGTELTEEGRTLAIEVLRHHRLLEAYLAEHLDYSWDEVHDEADTLEHHISEEFERRVAEVLGDPAVDPHGDPIPSADLEPPTEAPTVPLSSCETGDRIVVARVDDRDDDDLAYLADAGITPGTQVVVSDVAPFGMVTVAVDDAEQSLPESVADSIAVAPADQADEIDEQPSGADA
ncbi:metal-dependent transcriptional regulator [Halobaculum sp. MBLA0147]|uniref:metal-dependent transcriptional regulator n=1 Tax=Halobaculum sp. MBLA0147 TaxID=3079934 RepID=UPI003523C455